MNSAILTIDQSTSATKAVLFGRNAEVVAKISREHAQVYPQQGWVEHDPEEIFANTLEVISGIVKAVPDTVIRALAITNQRETVLVWDRKTGKPVYNAIVWQCNRGAERCRKLLEDGWEQRIREKTGLVIDPYFSATGISWILDNVPGARERALRGELLFGTTDCWLIWNLTGGMTHATDFSNACRTMLFNINTLSWDREIMDELGIPLSMAPVVKYSDALFGKITAGRAFLEPVPITGVMGDSHAALFGQLCTSPGMAKATYGTGSSIMMNIGSRPLPAPRGLVTSIGYGVKGAIAYVFEGNIHSTGSAIKWLKDGLELIGTVEESSELAASVESAEGVYFVPAFSGLGAPYWDHRARAIISGMTFRTRKAHVVRAALESIAYQVKDLVDLMKEGCGIESIELRVDGGPVRNRFLMEYQSALLGSAINKSLVEEASASGVALAAGLSAGWWSSLAELESLRKGEVIKGGLAPGVASTNYEGWKNAVRQAMYNSGKMISPEQERHK